MPNFREMLTEYQNASRVQPWSGTFSDYLDLVIASPHLAQSAHSRIYKMICAKGVTRNETDGKEHYEFFDKDLFGIDDPLYRVIEYFKAASLGSDVGRRILLLYGPPSSGKSQLAILLKKGLEEYTKTNEGAVYAIANCPQHEDPLNLMPHAMRRPFQDQTGIIIQGEPCPMCRLRLNESSEKGGYDGDVYNVPVKRVIFSETERCGIGTFVPSDPKSQDIAELVGSMDLSNIGEFGSESDPRAYRFDGELNVANRGIMEFIEMLKADERFLYVLLTLAQEKNIKTGRFPLIYADECVISHTNETEYNEFMADKKSEALHDRMIRIRIPYNLKVSQEERIYEKLLVATKANLPNLHIAPHMLRVAAMFGVLSRLETPTAAGLTLIKKLKLYDGEDVEGFRQKDVKQIKEGTIREGMDGISPRFIINRISTALILPDTRCVNPIDVLRALKEGIELADYKKDKEKYLQLIADARKEYDETARTDVQKAFFVSFEQEAKTLVSNYLDNVEAYLDKTKLLDPITGEEVAPDEKLMRALENKVQIPEHGKDSFRNEIFRKVAMAHRRKEDFDYTTHDKLKTAIEKQLFEERRDTIKLTIGSRAPDTEQLKKFNQVVETLIEREGYCSGCANELLKYVSSLLAREK
ncbi:MAG: protein prkA [bacterium]|nr:protein prkA [bacterium]